MNKIVNDINRRAVYKYWCGSLAAAIYTYNFKSFAAAVCEARNEIWQQMRKYDMAYTENIAAIHMKK